MGDTGHTGPCRVWRGRLKAQRRDVEHKLGKQLRRERKWWNTSLFSSERHKSTSPGEPLLSSDGVSAGRRPRASASTRDREVYP